MQIEYGPDIAIIQNAAQNPLPRQMNRSIFSKFTSTTIKTPSFSSPKTAQKSSFFINWRNKTPQKFRLTPSFKNEVNIHQQTTCSKLRPSSDCLLCLFEYMWKINDWRSFCNVVFSRNENFDAQSYKEQFRALVSNIQFFRAKWCKYFIGLISPSSNFQHMTTFRLFIRIGQSFYIHIDYDKEAVNFFPPKTAKKTIFLNNWWNGNPQKVWLTSNFKNDVKLPQPTFRSKWRPSSDFLMCLLSICRKQLKEVNLQCCFQPPREFRYANLYGAFQSFGIKHSVF